MLIRLLSFMLLMISLVSYGQQTAVKQHYTIAINKTTYPYQFLNNQGEPDGLMVDLWRLWAKKQQVSVDFVALSWAETLQQVKSGEIDVHAGLGITQARLQYLDYTPSFFKQNAYLYVAEELSNVSSIEQLKPYTIGSVKQSQLTLSLRQQYPELQIKTYTGRHDKYDAAIKHEILAFTDLEHISGGYPKYNELQNLFPSHKRLLLAELPYAGAVKKGNKALLQYVNQGLAQITLAEKAEIERKWLGVEKERRNLRLAFSIKLPPYMSLTPSGKAQGFFVDLWRLWSKYSGRKIEFVASEMAQAIKMVRDNQADVHIAYPENDQFNTGLMPAWKLYEVNSRVFVHSSANKVTDFTQLAGNAVAVYDTAPYREQLEQQYPDISFKYFTNADDMLRAADLGEVSAIISAVDNFKIKLAQTNQVSAYRMLDFPVFHSRIYSLVQPENKALAKVIREGFEQIPTDEMLALEKKWLGEKKHYYFQQLDEHLQLSLAERKWRNEQQSKGIKVGVVRHWRPMEFIDNKGNIAGVNKEMLDIVASRTGLNFSYRTFENWQEMLDALEQNQIDLVGGAAITTERKQQYLFTEPYWSMPWVVVHPQNMGQLTSIEDYFGKRLAVVKGYHMVTKLRQQYPQINLMLLDTAEQGLKALQQGQVDGVIEPLSTASEFLKVESLTPLMISVIDELQTGIEENYSHFMSRSDWPYLNSILNKGIASISEQEKQQVYEHWFDVKVQTGFNKAKVISITLQLGVLILLVIVVIVIWNRKLYREIKRREQLETKMRHMATHDSLTGLANRTLLDQQLAQLIPLHQRQGLSLAVLFLDLDGFKLVNDKYGHDVGDELLVLLSERLKQCVRQSDLIVRFGGDEFILLLTNLNSADEASFVADKVLKMVKQPFKLSKVTSSIGCSIGISIFPEDGDSAVELIKIADTLMYKVKASGKNNYAFSSQ